MKIQKLPLLTILVLACTASAHAGTKFAVEPYLGYGLLGGLSSTTSGTTTNLGSFTGVALGSRVSVAFQDMFFAGADVSYSPSLGYAAATGASSGVFLDDATTRFTLGVVAGVEMPILPLRIWLGYNFLDNLADGSVAGGTVSKGLNGSSFKFGAGYKVIPLVSLNAEYTITNFGSSSSAGVSSNLNAGQTAGINTLLLSASFPIEL